MKTFNIFGTDWTYENVESIEDDKDGYLFGQCIPASHHIKVANVVDEVEQSDKEKELTFYHELVHAIFSTGQYLNSYNDEPLVEWIARCIYSLKQQKII